METALSALSGSLTGGFEKREGADDVRLDELAGAENRPIDMRFRGKMDDQIEPVSLEKFADQDVIDDIDLLEQISASAMLLRNRSQIGGVSGIGQLVNIDHGSLEIGFLEQVIDEVGPDEAASARDQDFIKLWHGWFPFGRSF